jgi:hypothetical protein
VDTVAWDALHATAVRRQDPAPQQVGPPLVGVRGSGGEDGQEVFVFVGFQDGRDCDDQLVLAAVTQASFASPGPLTRQAAASQEEATKIPVGPLRRVTRARTEPTQLSGGLAGRETVLRDEFVRQADDSGLGFLDHEHTARANKVVDHPVAVGCWPTRPAASSDATSLTLHRAFPDELSFQLSEDAAKLHHRPP